MQIVEITEKENHELETFKSSVWPSADKEHYGENQPSFYKENLTLIAKEGNKIVGYISVVIDTGVAQIEPLMIKTDLIGTGIGSALLKAIENKMKLIGVHKIWLETGLDWKAKSFYEKHGYQVRVILPNHIGGIDFVLLDKMM